MIRARRHVRYVMELAVPRGAPAGVAKLGWSLNTASGPAVGGIVTVTAR